MENGELKGASQKTREFFGVLKDLEEIKKLQQKIEKDFLENEKEILQIEKEVEDLEILDEFVKAIKKVEEAKKEAEIELNSTKSDVKEEIVNFDKMI